MGKKHSPRFLKLCQGAKDRILELSLDEVKAKLDRGEAFLLVDTREESEWAEWRIPGAIYMGKGVIERDIEVQCPDLATEIVCYCGGGFRSALVAEALGKMGYTQVSSMEGGLRGWDAAGYPVDRDLIQ